MPLYLRAIKPNGLNIVAVSDRDAAIAEQVGAQLRCRAYGDADELLDKETPDFVFAFDIHSEMPVLAMNLINRGIAFSIEKPLGLCAQDIEMVISGRRRDMASTAPFLLFGAIALWGTSIYARFDRRRFRTSPSPLWPDLQTGTSAPLPGCCIRKLRGQDV